MVVRQVTASWNRVSAQNSGVLLTLSMTSVRFEIRNQFQLFYLTNIFFMEWLPNNQQLYRCDKEDFLCFFRWRNRNCLLQRTKPNLPKKKCSLDDKVELVSDFEPNRCHTQGEKNLRNLNSVFLSYVPGLQEKLLREAFQFSLIGVENKHPFAYYTLGLCYYGEGITKDEDRQGRFKHESPIPSP